MKRVSPREAGEWYAEVPPASAGLWVVSDTESHGQSRGLYMFCRLRRLESQVQSEPVHQLKSGPGF